MPNFVCELTRFAGTPASTLADGRVRAYAVYLLARQGIKPNAALANVEQELSRRHTQAWPTDLAAAYLAATYRLMQRNNDADRIIRDVPWALEKRDWGENVYYDGLVHDAQLLYLLARHFPARLGVSPPPALEAISSAVSGNRSSSLSVAYTLLALDAYARAAADAGKLEGSRRFALPQHAPHFVDALLRGRSAATDRASNRIVTTLDLRLQRLVERQIQRYLQQHRDRGIRNVAALLVDPRDMSVKAWAGSAGYWNESIDGQVNGVLAKRSPGSTLKPFVYALAVHCPHTVETWYIPGKSPIRVSQLHQAVALDIETGRPTCPPYSPDTVRFDVFEYWSSDMLQLFRQAGMPRPTPPVLPDCAAQDSAEAPRIASPLRNVSYTLRRNTKDEAIALEASVAAGVRSVFWFDGSALIGHSAVSEGALAWRPAAAGAHLIRVIDDHGRAAERDVQVQFAP